MHILEDIFKIMTYIHILAVYLRNSEHIAVIQQRNLKLDPKSKKLRTRSSYTATKPKARYFLVFISFIIFLHFVCIEILSLLQLKQFN